MGSQGSLWISFPELINAKGGEAERQNTGLRLVSVFTNELTTGIQKGSHLRYEQLVSFIIVCSIYLVTSNYHLSLSE